MNSTDPTARGVYEQMKSVRDPYLRRGRDAAKLTLPYLLPDEGSSGSTDLPTPWQSIGARGVNNLAAALLLALLPPNQSFFRLIPDASVLAELTEAGGSEMKTQLEQSLAKIEQTVMREIEVRSYRPSVFEALKLLVATGNTCFHIPREGPPKTYRLDKYVCKRDAEGRLVRLIIEENISRRAIPQEIADKVSDTELKGEVSLYTHILWTGRKYEVFQEILGHRVPKSEGSYPEDQLPWLVLRLNCVEGEDYGRGYVEQYIGDLKSAEGLTRSLVEGAAASAKILFFVDPNSTAGTRQAKIATAANGAILPGRAEDVTVLQANKAPDLSTAYQTLGTIQERLSYAFLLTESTIRKAERVTAAEVRLVTQSLERQLGGVYSVLSNEFQLPMVRQLMAGMRRARRLPKLPKKLIEPAIVTGIDALGRGSDLDKLDEFLNRAGTLLGPDLPKHVNMSAYLARAAAALSLEDDGLVYTSEERQAMQQQEQQAMLAQAVAGPMATAAMSGAQQNGNTDNAA